MAVWGAGGELQASWQSPKVSALAFDHGGQLLLGVDAEVGRLVAWEAGTGRERWAARVAGLSGSLAALSPDGLVAAVRSGPGVVIDLTTGIPLGTLNPGVQPAAVAFASDGRAVVVAGEWGAVQRWWLPAPWPDEPAAAAAWVHRLTGLRLDPQGELAEAPAGEAARAAEYATAGGAWEKPPARTDWHSREADRALAERNWSAALAHIEKLLGADPGRPEVLARRAKAYRGLGRWAEAAADVSRAIARKPDDHELLDVRANARAELGEWAGAAADWREAWRIRPAESDYGYKLGLALLGSGGVAEYRGVCRELLRAYGGSEKTGHRDTVAWLGTVLPPDDPRADALVEVATAEVARSPQSEGYLETFGAALYRAGRYPEALAALTKAVEAHGGGGTVWMRFFLAMTCHRLAREPADRWGGLAAASPLASASIGPTLDAAAVQWYRSAAEQLKPEMKPDWQNAVRGGLLRAEAAALLGEPARGGPSP